MTTESFQGLSLVTARDVTAASQDCTPPAVAGQQNSVQQYLIAVLGTVDIFVAFGAAATIPATGGTGTGFPIKAGATVVFSVAPGVSVNVIAAGPGSTVYVQSGKGS